MLPRVRASRRIVPAVLLGITAVAVAPCAAGAATPQVLRDVAPTALAPVVADRVLTSTPPALRASTAAARTRLVTATDGSSVDVSFASGYTQDDTVAQSYVDFLASMPHGSELSRLKMVIATPAQVTANCGGVDGTLACYNGATGTMIVPGTQSGEAARAGLSTSYVVAHEYGHHLAANRSNAPFSALDLGPKQWSSYERVCAQSLDEKLFPGDEGEHYLRNPGEAWAETYAHLQYPEVGWSFTSLLRPDAGAEAAARKDIATPWTTRRSKTFTGTFTATGDSTRTFRVPLKLDGALDIDLSGPSGAQLDLAVSSNGKSQGTTRAAGSDDSLGYEAACLTTSSERLTVRVLRRSGTGPFTVKVRYAG